MTEVISEPDGEDFVAQLCQRKWARGEDPRRRDPMRDAPQCPCFVGPVEIESEKNAGESSDSAGPLRAPPGHDQLDAGKVETLEVAPVEREQSCRPGLKGAAQDQGIVGATTGKSPLSRLVEESPGLGPAK